MLTLAWSAVKLWAPGLTRRLAVPEPLAIIGHPGLCLWNDQ